jgi:hypothetical protein
MAAKKPGLKKTGGKKPTNPFASKGKKKGAKKAKTGGNPFAKKGK